MNSEERMYFVENQKVTISKDISGEKILDIGGGGEGVIGQCYGDKVIAIDPSKAELEEAPDGPIKVVMDARKLGFLDNSFHAVTSFFTLMYIDKIDHKKVFSEIYRVLKCEGAFVLWDTKIPKYDGGAKDIFVAKLSIEIPNKTLHTGYGVLWKGKQQDIEYYIKLGKEVGFKVAKRELNESVFKVEFKK